MEVFTEISFIGYVNCLTSLIGVTNAEKFKSLVSREIESYFSKLDITELDEKQALRKYYDPISWKYYRAYRHSTAILASPVPLSADVDDIKKAKLRNGTVKPLSLSIITLWANSNVYTMMKINNAATLVNTLFKEALVQYSKRS